MARLHLLADADQDIEARFGKGATVTYQLHPPFMKALGLHRKIGLGPWVRPAFRTLVAARRLRGTPFDPFGAAGIRRLERDLIAEYCDVIDRLLARLDRGNYQLAAKIASLPDTVRGYEEVKLENVETYRARLRELLARYEQGPGTETPASGRAVTIDDAHTFSAQPPSL